MSLRTIFLFAATTAAIAALAGCSHFLGSSCTAVGCLDGVQIDVGYRDAGSYVFEIDVDGELTTCRTSFPVESSSRPECDRVGVRLSHYEPTPGGEPVTQFFLETTSARRVRVIVKVDGRTTTEKVFDVKYDVRPGPNGPDCAPAECRIAKVSLP